LLVAPIVKLTAHAPVVCKTIILLTMFAYFAIFQTAINVQVIIIALIVQIVWNLIQMEMLAYNVIIQTVYHALQQMYVLLASLEMYLIQQDKHVFNVTTKIA
jgi:hypothetical protein